MSLGWKTWQTALFKQHHIVNFVWLNLHEIAPGVYRSAQPTPWQLARLKKKLGLKSVVNLRGDNPRSAVHQIEKRACERLGLELFFVEFYSRSMPERFRLEALKEAFEQAPRPMLIHCKAGADRSSLAAVLYLYWFENLPLEEAMRRQMRFWPYGYIRHSKAGIMEHYLRRYLEARAHAPALDLETWTEKMDREAEKSLFEKRQLRPSWEWASRHLLGRE
ncbi:tyrosine-protein phosphatase [Hydrogenimonas sp.]